MSAMELNNQELIERIRYMMETMGLNAATLAQQLNLNTSRIAHILSGRNNPSLEVVCRICEVFPEWNHSWIIFGLGAPQRFSSENHASEYDHFQDELFSNESTVTEKVTNSPSLLFSNEEAQILKKRLLDTSIKKDETALPKREIQEIRLFYNDDSYEVFRKVEK